MYATVISHSGGIEVYSSWFNDPKKAIEYAEGMPGIIKVEKAHANEPPIWERKKKNNT